MKKERFEVRNPIFFFIDKKRENVLTKRSRKQASVQSSGDKKGQNNTLTHKRDCIKRILTKAHPRPWNLEPYLEVQKVSMFANATKDLNQNKPIKEKFKEDLLNDTAK